jgi:hypothetical protein
MSKFGGNYIMDAIGFLKEKGWEKADILINSVWKKEVHKNKTIEEFSDLPIQITRLIIDKEDEVEFKGRFIVIASLVSPAEDSPSLTKENTEINVLFIKKNKNL